MEMICVGLICYNMLRLTNVRFNCLNFFFFFYLQKEENFMHIKLG
jgi:hypothetical protein